MAKSYDGIRIPGLNIRSPWASMILSKNKTVETRGYPLPKKFLNTPIALIETPGKTAKSRARIIGVISIVHCFQYGSEAQWKRDQRHKVPHNDPMYGFRLTKEKWGWVVKVLAEVVPPISAPKKRGIKYCASCSIPRSNLSSNFGSDR